MYRIGKLCTDFFSGASDPQAQCTWYTQNVNGVMSADGELYYTFTASNLVQNSADRWTGTQLLDEEQFINVPTCVKTPCAFPALWPTAATEVCTVV